MTTAVRNTDEELTSNHKCMISGLMTDWGLTSANTLNYKHSRHHRAVSHKLLIIKVLTRDLLLKFIHC